MPADVVPGPIRSFMLNGLKKKGAGSNRSIHYKDYIQTATFAG